MPTLTAATWALSARGDAVLFAIIFRSVMTVATYIPVIDAVRVPPSA